MKHSFIFIFTISVSVFFALTTGKAEESPEPSNDAVKFFPLKTIRIYESRDASRSVQFGEFLRQDGRKGTLDGEVISSLLDKTSNISLPAMQCSVQFEHASHEQFCSVGGVQIPKELRNAYYMSYLSDYIFQQGFTYPMPWGELYRVDEFRQRENRDYITLSHVTRAQLGIEGSLNYSMQYVPIMWDENLPAGGSLGGITPISFHYKYETSRAMEEGGVLATLMCGYGFPLEAGRNHPYTLPSGASSPVHEGNVIPLLDTGFQIVKIVPPNREKKISGWVEISPIPVLLRTRLGRTLEKMEAADVSPTPTPAR